MRASVPVKTVPTVSDWISGGGARERDCPDSGQTSKGPRHRDAVTTSQGRA